MTDPQTIVEGIEMKEDVRVPTAPGLRGFAPEPPTASQPEALVPSRDDIWRKWAAEFDQGNDEAPSASYWVNHADRDTPVKPLGRPCADCAVVNGFYAALSYDLASQPTQIIEKVCGNWFCHDNPTRGCAGNIEFVRFLRDSDAGFAGDAQRLHSEGAAARAEGIAKEQP